MKKLNNEAGSSMDIGGSAQAFLPFPLPPKKCLSMDGRVLVLLSEADLALGRLDGLSEMIDEKDLFVMMYIKKEAVWSSQIEGTQASLIDVLEFEGEALRPDSPRDIGEVVNYIAAMQLGLKRIKEGSRIDLSLIKDLHRKLMRDSRGGDLDPGEFRNVQNWVGPPGCSISDAVFVPPPPREMMISLKNLETFMNDNTDLPPLIRASLAHYQFETIHPFLDGNGRMGRLLILLILLRDGHLKNPLLYISHFFRMQRSIYYEKLQNVRERGEWEGWIGFFLKGVKEVSEEASKRSLYILSLVKEHREIILGKLGRNGPRAVILLNAMMRRPVLDVNGIREITGLSYQNANRMASQLEDLGILVEVTGQRRNRIFEYKEYLDTLEK
ncbi:MAG: Fic family protein [Thermoplasmatota archaeon]